MFLNAFHRQPDPSEALPPSGEPKPAAHGEFTQLFGVQSPVPPTPHPPPATTAARETPKQTSEEVTRIFVRQAPPQTEPTVRVVPSPAPPPPPNPPRMKGFSSPGASDSASADASFTQLFRPAPPSPTPSPRFHPPPAQASSPLPAVEKTDWPNPAPKSLGATELFRALSVADDGAPADRARPPVGFIL